MLLTDEYLPLRETEGFRGLVGCSKTFKWAQVKPTKAGTTCPHLHPCRQWSVRLVLPSRQVWPSRFGFSHFLPQISKTRSPGEATTHAAMSASSTPVDALGEPIPTSSVLMAASKHIAVRCRPENVAFLNCKKKDPNPEKCLEKGRQVTSCVLSLWVRLPRSPLTCAVRSPAARLDSLPSFCSLGFGTLAKRFVRLLMIQLNSYLALLIW